MHSRVSFRFIGGEQSHAFDGLYFVLMGKVSFIDGVGPKDLGFERLFFRQRKKR